VLSRHRDRDRGNIDEHADAFESNGDSDVTQRAEGDKLVIEAQRILRRSARI
jgi:hypothetical protein